MNQIYSLLNKPEVLKCFTELFPRKCRDINVLFRKRNNGKLPMDVGTEREKWIRTIFEYFAPEGYKKPDHAMVKEYDFELFDRKQSVKSVSSPGAGRWVGPKLCWASGLNNAEEFKRTYEPSCDMILIRIVWDNYLKIKSDRNESGVYFIPQEVQIDVLNQGRDDYFNHTTSVNPIDDSKGVKISSQAGWKLLEDSRTIKIPIKWGVEDIESQIFDEDKERLLEVERWLEDNKEILIFSGNKFSQAV